MLAAHWWVMPRTAIATHAGAQAARNEVREKDLLGRLHSIYKAFRSTFCLAQAKAVGCP